MNSKFKLLLIVTAFLVAGVGGSRNAYAAPQATGCSMLTPAQIQKVLGQPFGAPTQTKASPAYKGQSWGSSCEYRSTRANMRVDFLVYVDRSPSEAKQTFEKLSTWSSLSSHISKVSVGDEASIVGHAIHVLKGNVRYAVSISTERDKQVMDLAVAIAKTI
jgi:hypothetical protein